MADLGTLRPGNAATGAPVPWDSAPNGALGDDSDATYGFVSTNATNFYDQRWELDNMPADFASMDTLLVQVRYAWSATPTNTTWDSISAIARDSSGTALSNQTTIVSGPITVTSPTTSSAVGLTGLNTTADKTTWDGALIDLRIVRTKSKGGGSEEQRIHEAWITGTYTTSSGGSSTFVMWIGNP